MSTIDAHLHEPTITNRSRYENISSDLRELGDDIEHIAETVYKDIAAINWHGSIPRGDFVPHESDAVSCAHQKLKH